MNVIIGTAGHIDHGKSSLIQALTGINPDRLPEEKARGVTIDLGFAHLTIPHPKAGHPDFQVGAIDVPGHADFINNMVSGVGALDLAIFVVAADDCWMPQSEEHLHVLSYLGIENAVIALTKADICEDIEFTTEILKEELEGSPLADAPIIPVSSHTGLGLDDLRAELSRRLYEVTKSRSTAANKLTRMSVDRTFSPQGIGTVVTGTLTGASISVGDTLMLQPEGLTTSVRQIQNHNAQVAEGHPGMRAALNVPDLSIAERGKPGARRGSVLVDSDGGEITQTVDVHIQRNAREIPGQSQTRQPLKLPRKIIVHIGTSHVGARLVTLQSSELLPGQSDYGQLRLESPIHCFIGDRFVIRDASKLSTLAGGIVLDPLAEKRRFHSDAQLALLEARKSDWGNVDKILLSALQRDSILSLKRPVSNSPFTREAVAKSVAKLKKTGKLTSIGDALLDPVFWEDISVRASDIILAHHETQPDEPGLEAVALFKALGITEQTDLILQGLLTRGFVKRGDQIASEDHHLSLPPELERAASRIRAALSETPRQPPTRSAILTDTEEEKAYRFLLRSKEVIELEPKVILLTSEFQAMQTEVTAHLQSQTEATASDLRQMLETSRKVLMPFLELLDKNGITQRNGDVRVLKS